MSPDLLAERPGRARPVADAPVDELVRQADEIARRWAVSLVAARALADMADVPLQQLAREAPALCAQLSRALRSDAELARLLETPGARERSGPARPAALSAWIAAGADAGSAAVQDVEALRSVVWAAVLGELRDPSPSQVADLADRLAFVCACLLAGVLAGRAPLSAGAGAAPPSGPRRAEQILYSSPPSVPSGRQAVLIDEVAEVTTDTARAGATARRPGGADEQPSASVHVKTTPPPLSPAQRTGPPHTTPRARPWDMPLNGAATDEQSQRQGPTSGQALAELPGRDAVRVTRGPGSPVDERV